MESDHDIVEADEAGDEEKAVAERLPRWLAVLAIALMAGTVAAVFGWSMLWRPDADAWGEVKCRVEATQAWPRDEIQHRVVYERCIEQLP